MVLYMAADVVLRTLADDGPQPLTVRPINDVEESVRHHFSKRYIYFLGSHTGCSCGFSYGYGLDTDPDGRESVSQLGSYLGEAVRQAGEVELYACWDGDEPELPRGSARVDVAHFSGNQDEFQLAERWFAIVGPPLRS
jgi:hypothetical protein